MTRESVEARALHGIAIILWNEISMVPKWALEAVDLLLRDIMQNELPFGDKVMLLHSGEWARMLLQIGEEAYTEDENGSIELPPAL
ncbi:unnamed protein product [Haemonchus placei]|uniref:ATP-dependent DNA helicase n=1 Tax=Haemonchus placei TaxID=6290 RepID=A0A0N4WR16_HAEPC|nr:unnamed protein product [Haemonchus placei]